MIPHEARLAAWHQPQDENHTPPFHALICAKCSSVDVKLLAVVGKRGEKIRLFTYSATVDLHHIASIADGLASHVAAPNWLVGTMASVPKL
ncbi:MAG: hypothetical protein ABL878_18325 [Burkholderiales bacterium]